MFEIDTQMGDSRLQGVKGFKVRRTWKKGRGPKFTSISPDATGLQLRREFRGR